MIRLLDLPDFQRLNARMVQNRIVGVTEDHDLHAQIDTALQSVFGMEPWDYREDVEFIYLGEDGEWVFPLDDGSSTSADEMGELIQAWRRLGWDVTDADGKVAACLAAFRWAMLIASAGLKGKPMVEIEAEVWTRKRPAANSNATPKQKAMNNAFLSFGDQRRRGG